MRTCLEGARGLDSIEEPAELDRAVTLVALANHLAALGVKSGKQGHDAMPNLVMCAPLHLAWAHGQQWACAVQRLDLGPRTRPMLCQAGEVETHNVTDLFDEQRVCRQLESLRPVRLEGERTPLAADGVPTQTDLTGHGPRTPVHSILRCGLQGQRHHPLNVGIGHSAGSARPPILMPLTSGTGR